METFKTPEREIVVNELINFALNEIERKYGTGNDDGERPKKYHNLLHTQDTMDAAQKIAAIALEADKIKEEDLNQIAIAAAFHDIEVELENGANEARSVEIAAEKMRTSQLFSEQEIARVGNIMSATIVQNTEGLIQSADMEDYSTQILADADLANLGMETDLYFDHARRIFSENVQAINSDKIDETDFYKKQLQLLAKHHFYTKEARELFPHQEDNYNFIQSKLI